MPAADRSDQGAAVVDFVLVSALVVALFAVVFQVGLALHVRNVLTALAAEGARYGANADVDDEQAVVERTEEGIRQAFNDRVAGRSTVEADLDGRVVEVRVSTPLPIAFLYGGPVSITVAGHALEESRP